MSEPLQCFVFSGPPGSGKGTIAQQCEQRLGWLQLSTGDLCRKHISEGTKLGKQIDFAIKSGKLVDDELIIDMVAQWIKKHKGGGRTIIFDGFPRTVVQAQLFLKLIEKKLQWLKLVIVDFKINDELVVERLSARRICGNKECQAVYSVIIGSKRNPLKENKCDHCGTTLVQRSDDLPETVKSRLEVYYQHSDMVLDFYKQHGLKVYYIDASQSVHDVLQIINRIRELQ